MPKKKKYDLKVPYEFYEVIQEYLNKNPKLAYSSVSAFLNELIRNKVKEILESEDSD